jgi:hypothetical protein
MSNDHFQINDSLAYAQTDRDIDGDISWVSFKPTSIETYVPGQSIEYKLRSNSEFLILDCCYIKWSYAELGLVTTGSALWTAAASAFFSQVDLELELTKNITQSLTTATSQSIRFLKLCQQYCLYVPACYRH